MLPDRVSNLGPLTYESGALPTALHGPALPSTGTDRSEQTVQTQIRLLPSLASGSFG